MLRCLSKRAVRNFCGIAVGFGLYRAASGHFYGTAMSSTSVKVGLVADVSFAVAFNAAALAVGLAFALLSGLRGRVPGRALYGGAAASLTISCVLMAAPFASSGMPFAMAAAGILAGAALAVLYILWLGVFVAQAQERLAILEIMAGYMLSGALGAVLAKVPLAVSGILALSMMGLSMLPFFLAWRREQPCGRLPEKMRWRNGASLAPTFVAFFVLVGVVGLFHTGLLGSSSESAAGSQSSWPSTLASALAVLGLVVSVGGGLKTEFVYKTCFPLVIVALSFLPFSVHIAGFPVGAIVIFCYKVCSIVILLFLVHETRRLGWPSWMLGSFFMIGSCLSLLIGLGLGAVLGPMSARLDVSLITMLSFAGIYPLAIVLLALARRESSQKTLRPEGVCDEGESGGAGGYGQASAEAGHIEEDPVQSAAEAYGLTKREREILEYLARGRSARFIAEALVISENTVWFHIKKIYAKTGVHGKQELMSLIERGDVRLPASPR